MMKIGPFYRRHVTTSTTDPEYRGYYMLYDRGRFVAIEWII